MSYEPIHDRASIVLLGQFNPAIFQPAWLARHALIRDEEAMNVKKLVVTEQVTNFEVDWLTLSVTTQRFSVFTDQAAYSMALRDLVLGAFSLLEHTPFWALGMNRHLHYRVESEDQWHQYGHFLVPKEPWTGLIDKPGMRAVTIWGTRPEAPGARIQYVVEPSQRVRPWGLYFSFNEDRDLRRQDASDKKTERNEEERKEGETDEKKAAELSSPQRRRELMEAVGKGWESAQGYARSVAEALLDRGRDARGR
jgi:hypothetical protein